jgi:hypothetical protein
VGFSLTKALHKPTTQRLRRLNFIVVLSTRRVRDSLCFAIGALKSVRGKIMRVSKYFTIVAGAAWLCGIIAWTPALADDGAAASDAHAPGIWQKHKYSFVFMGFTTTYSCDGLASKLKTLLLAAGARSDVKSRPSVCSAYGRPDKFARADLTFYSLAPANPTDAAAHPVDGIWKSVALSRNSPRDLALGDCEVVQQFKDLVLPMFTTRNLSNNTTCIPHQLSGSVIDLKFESFTAAPPPPAAGAKPGA